MAVCGTKTIVTAVSSPSAAEIDFFFLLDVSGSMSGERLENAKKCFADIVDTQLLPSDRISVISFDTKAFFKLKPHPVRRIRDENNELPSLMARIRAMGNTACYDAIHMAYSAIHDKTRRTVLVVLTDGKDNSSDHTLKDVERLCAKHPAVSLNIIQIGKDKVPIEEYKGLCKDRGEFLMVETTTIVQKSVAFMTKAIKTQRGRRQKGRREKGPKAPKGAGKKMDWECGACNFMNWARRKTCKNCGASRPFFKNHSPENEEAKEGGGLKKNMEKRDDSDTGVKSIAYDKLSVVDLSALLKVKDAQLKAKDAALKAKDAEIVSLREMLRKAGVTDVAPKGKITWRNKQPPKESASERYRDALLDGLNPLFVGHFDLGRR